MIFAHDCNNKQLASVVELVTPTLEEQWESEHQSAEDWWDLVAVDEAHHLRCTPERASIEYEVVEQISQSSISR